MRTYLHHRVSEHTVDGATLYSYLMGDIERAITALEKLNEDGVIPELSTAYCFEGMERRFIKLARETISRVEKARKARALRFRG